VETLAHLAQIAAYGASWFRELGTEREPGSRLLTVSGAVERPGVYEIANGTPVANVLLSAGGAPQDVSAVLVGGYFGTWLRPERALPARLSEQSLRDLGASPGSGVLVFLAKDVCGLAESARVATWFSQQTADQCGPCVHGLAAIARGMTRLARDDADHGTADRLVRWAGDVEGRGACRLPDGAVRFVRSALSVFDDEIEQHRAGACSATVHEPALPLEEVRR
jgi:NADH:ubiquinone oxidoreductase subunit F (NADH-binding)